MSTDPDNNTPCPNTSETQVFVTAPELVGDSCQQENSPKKKSRTVSFPDDNHIVTQYFEPANPWQDVALTSRAQLAAEYLESCRRHHTAPIELVLQQIRELPEAAIGGTCRAPRLVLAECDLQGAAPADALEAVLRKVQFKKVEIDHAAVDDEGAEAIFDMIEYYESALVVSIIGDRQFGIRGWQAASRMIKKSAELSELEVSERSLEASHAAVMCRALRPHASRLRSLCLRQASLAGEPLLYLVIALKSNTSLRELRLGDNGLTPTDAAQIGSMLRLNTRLQLLDLSNNLIQDVGLRHIADALVEQAAHTPPSPASPGSLPLHVGSCEARGLAYLVLWNNQLTRNCAPHLTRALRASRSLCVLNIGRNCVGADGVSALSAGVTLASAGLQAARLGPDAAPALATALRDNTALQRLDLRDNRLGLSGLQCILAALKHNTVLTQIDLDEPADPGSEEAAVIRELAALCRRNEPAAASPDRRAHRKISLTCHTAAPQPHKAWSGGGLGVEEERRRLRSPAPSPAGSPVPTAHHNRFSVTRVTPERESSTDSSRPSTPTRPGCCSTPSRFKVVQVSEPPQIQVHPASNHPRKSASRFSVTRNYDTTFNPQTPPPSPAPSIGSETDRPCTPDMRPCTPDLRPCTPDLRPSPCTPDLRPGTPDLRPCTPDLGPCTTDLRPCTPDLRPCTPDLRPCSPDLVPNSPDLRPCTTLGHGPHSPEMGPNSPDLGPNVAQLGPYRTELGPSAEKLRCGTPEVETSDCRPVTPSVGLNTSEIRNDIPQVDLAVMDIRLITSGIGQNTSKLKQETTEVGPKDIKLTTPASELRTTNTQELRPSNTEVQPTRQVLEPDSSGVRPENRPSKPEIRPSVSEVRSSIPEVKPIQEVRPITEGWLAPELNSSTTPTENKRTLGSETMLILDAESRLKCEPRAICDKPSTIEDKTSVTIPRNVPENASLSFKRDSTRANPIDNVKNSVKSDIKDKVVAKYTNRSDSESIIMSDREMGVVSYSEVKEKLQTDSVRCKNTGASELVTAEKTNVEYKRESVRTEEKNDATMRQIEAITEDLGNLIQEFRDMSTKSVVKKVRNDCTQTDDGDSIDTFKVPVNVIRENVVLKKNKSESSLDSPDLEVSRFMNKKLGGGPFCDSSSSLEISGSSVESLNTLDNQAKQAIMTELDRRKMDIVLSTESSIESNTSEVTPVNSNLLNMSVSSNESVSPIIFGKTKKIHGSLSSLEASVSSLDSNRQEKVMMTSADSGIEYSLQQHSETKDDTSNEGTLTNNSSLKDTVKKDLQVTITSPKRTSSLLDVPALKTKGISERMRKISWVAPSPSFHIPKQEPEKEIKLPSHLDKLLSLFQHPLFSRSSNEEERRSTSNTPPRKDSSLTSSFWSWGSASEKDREDDRDRDSLSEATDSTLSERVQVSYVDESFSKKLDSKTPSTDTDNTLSEYQTYQSSDVSDAPHEKVTTDDNLVQSLVLSKVDGACSNGNTAKTSDRTDLSKPNDMNRNDVRPADENRPRSFAAVLKSSGSENSLDKQTSPETGKPVDKLPSKVIRGIKENISPENTLTSSMTNTKTLALELSERQVKNQPIVNAVWEVTSKCEPKTEDVKAQCDLAPIATIEETCDDANLDFIDDPKFDERNTSVDSGVTSLEGISDDKKYDKAVHTLTTELGNVDLGKDALSYLMYENQDYAKSELKPPQGSLAQELQDAHIKEMLDLSPELIIDEAIEVPEVFTAKEIKGLKTSPVIPERAKIKKANSLEELSQDDRSPKAKTIAFKVPEISTTTPRDIPERRSRLRTRSGSSPKSLPESLNKPCPLSKMDSLLRKKKKVSSLGKIAKDSLLALNMSEDEIAEFRRSYKLTSVESLRSLESVSEDANSQSGNSVDSRCKACFRTSQESLMSLDSITEDCRCPEDTEKAGHSNR